MTLFFSLSDSCSPGTAFTSKLQREEFEVFAHMRLFIYLNLSPINC